MKYVLFFISHAEIQWFKKKHIEIVLFFWWSRIEKCWRWCLEAYGGMGGRVTAAHTYQWHWSLSRLCKNAETAICTFFILVRKVRYVPTSSRLRAVLMSLAVFGMSGPFLCPSVLKQQQPGLGTREKGPLLCYVAVIRKRTRRCSQDLPPQGPQGAMFYEALNHNAPSLWLRGPAELHTMSFILISPHTFMYGLACVWAAVNISSYCIIHILHLMQYLIHVHCITTVYFTAYKHFSA